MSHNIGWSQCFTQDPNQGCSQHFSKRPFSIFVYHPPPSLPGAGRPYKSITGTLVLCNVESP